MMKRALRTLASLLLLGSIAQAQFYGPDGRDFFGETPESNALDRQAYAQRKANELHAQELEQNQRFQFMLIGGIVVSGLAIAGAIAFRSKSA